MLKYILAWFPMIIIAIVNGYFREKFLVNYFNKLQAHQFSSVSMIILLAIYNWILFKIFFPASVNQAMFIGLIWLIFTVTFEFLFGHYLLGHSWPNLLNDYNIFKGRVWIFVLIWISIVPYIIYRIQE